MAIKLINDENLSYLKVKDLPFRILGGEVSNSLGADIDSLRKVFPKLKLLNLNTVLISVSWELIEPKEGEFDFTHLLKIIKLAEISELKIIFLWFATWKNATSSYVPVWVKSDVARFPRMKYSSGVSSNAISCFSGNACYADSLAFAQLMKWLKKIDSDNQTVIMIQLENEVGTLSTSRDYSSMAEEAIQKSVPNILLEGLIKEKNNLSFSINANNLKEDISWNDAFANNSDEIFMAWHFAKYIDKIAEAGKAEYDLPFFVNTWVSQPGKDKPGQYPSGGPIAKVLEIWRIASNHLSFFAPDIYTKDFRKVSSSFKKEWNPLMIPEAMWDNRSASQALYVFGEHNALGYSPFSCDNIEFPHPIMDAYKFLDTFNEMLFNVNFIISTAGFYQQEDNETFIIPINQLYINVQTVDIKDIPGGGFIAEVSKNEFIVAGWNAEVEFSTNNLGCSNIEFLYLETGYIQNGDWVSGQRLNGDETYHGKTARLGSEFTCCKIKLNMMSAPMKHQASWGFID